MKTIIINSTVVTMDEERQIFDPGFVRFEDGRITGTGSMDTLLKHCPHYERNYEVVDGKRGILMPGMVNVHTHMGMIPFRGLGDDYSDRLRVFLLPMEQKAMDAELVSLSTSYAAAEMLLSGITCVFDMYYFEEAAADAMEQIGIRGIAAQTLMDSSACDFKSPFEAIKYGERLMKKYEGHPRIRACLAPHGTNTCSREVLKAAHEIDCRYHMPFSLHTAEMDYEMQFFRENCQMTPVSYLDSIGVLDQYTLAAHCIHMTEADLLLLRRRGARVGHCIGSNTKAAKGVAPVKRMRESGIAVGLGTDGPASGNTLDLFTQMRLCANIHKTENRDRSAFPAESIVEMATSGGARALGMEKEIGSIEVGKRADLVLVETESVNMFPVYEPYSALVYSANASNVSQVFVDGICLVRDKQFINSDRKELRERLARKMNGTAFGEIKQF